MEFCDLNRYDYELPPELIRKKGVEPRDTARLFVYDTATDTIRLDIFRNLAAYLPAESLMVLNNTRVLPARLWLRKETGGKIEVFVLANQIEDETRIPVLLDRKAVVGQKLFFPDQSSFEVVGQEENIFFVRLEAGKDLRTLLETFGETPLPHYLEGEGTPEEELRTRYQTVFAEAGASVAAPTASLHFTEEVFEKLEEKGIQSTQLTLNVGLGTFAPLREEHFAKGTLHREFVVIPKGTAQALLQAKAAGHGVVAVGTTVARTLEAAAQLGSGAQEGFTGAVDIFIAPPYRFQAVDHLLTNFHLPRTSLMLLVDAFLESKGSRKGIMELYERAIEEGFAFYSFGDSMLIL